jgi:signal peptidase II
VAAAGARRRTAPLRGLLAFWSAATIVALADQLTKQLVTTRLRVGEGVTMIAGLVRIRHARNPVGLFQALLHLDRGYRVLLLVLVPLAIIGGLVLAFRRLGEVDNRLELALGLLVGGAVGNLVDRLLRASVVDFIQLGDDRFHTKVFNLADAAMIAGLAIVAISLFRRLRTAA